MIDAQDSEQVHAISMRLRQVPTSAVKGILRELGVEHVVVRGLQQIIRADHAVAGPARTLRFLPRREDINQPPRGAVNRQLMETLQPDEILVIDALGNMEAAVLGDMLGARAAYRGISAVVADGVVRDVSGLADLGLPVFARGTHPDPSSRRLFPWEADVPIQCGGALVFPRDWILADHDAVLVIPSSMVDAVVDYSEEALINDAFSHHLLSSGSALDDAYPIPSQRFPDLERFKRERISQDMNPDP